LGEWVFSLWPGSGPRWLESPSSKWMGAIGKVTVLPICHPHQEGEGSAPR
jgi:hypothetical protein